MLAFSDDTLYQLTEQLAISLKNRQWQLTTAESCTGGWIAKCCTDLPGSSQWFTGGVISYSNTLKQQLLKVHATLLNQHGAVSAEVVEAMALGALQQFNADLSVAVSGIAGPDGATNDKPVGLVWFGFASNEQLFTMQQIFAGDRQAVRRQAVAFALQQLIKVLE